MTAFVIVWHYAFIFSIIDFLGNLTKPRGTLVKGEKKNQTVVPLCGWTFDMPWCPLSFIKACSAFPVPEGCFHSHINEAGFAAKTQCM